MPRCLHDAETRNPACAACGDHPRDLTATDYEGWCGRANDEVQPPRQNCASALLGPHVAGARTHAAHAYAARGQPEALALLSETERITARDLQARLAAGAGAVRLVDVRPVHEYDMVHLPDAISMRAWHARERARAPMSGVAHLG